MYEVEILPAARRQLKKLPANVQTQILDRIEERLYRVRSGDYRIVYSINDEQVFVFIVKVGHRRDVYR